MSELVHHKSLDKTPRARKYQPTQAQRVPDKPPDWSPEQKFNYIAVFYDLETTGLITSEVEIANLAAEVDRVWLEKVTNGTIDEPEWFESLVRPNQFMPNEAIAIHGITDKDLVKAPGVKFVLEAWFEWLVNLRELYGLASTFPILLVAHNGHRFDQVVLQQEMMKSELMLPADVWFGDTLFSMRNGVGLNWMHYVDDPDQEMSSYPTEMSLEKLVRSVCLREGYTQEHSAMKDVEALLDVAHAFRWRPQLYEALWADKQGAFSQKQLIEHVLAEEKKTKKRQQASDEWAKKRQNSSNSYQQVAWPKKRKGSNNNSSSSWQGNSMDRYYDKKPRASKKKKA